MSGDDDAYLSAATARIRALQRDYAVAAFGPFFAAMTAAAPPAFDPVPELLVDDGGTATFGTWGGYLLQVAVMAFNDRVVMTPEDSPGGYDHGWCYPKGGAAAMALLLWDPGTEAEPASYERRVTPGPRAPGQARR